MNELLVGNVWWLREAMNPVLPPGEAGSFDSGCCMNPWVLRAGDAYHLYYAGADDAGFRRICKATAPVADPTSWRRLGPLFDVGAPGSFDARWNVLPHVVPMGGDRWHCYYTANSGVGEGLDAFPGIGLAISEDGGATWDKYAGNPILPVTRREGDPDRWGIAGGSVLRVRLPGGGTEWRYYYTGCPTLGDDIFLNQQKRCCLAVSQDGIAWERRGAVMFRDPDHDYENVAVAGPVVQQREDGAFIMWYSAIGTRWGAYSIAYAESEDGLTWRRGTGYGDNLQLGPAGQGWERQMVEYPSVIREGDHWRLFYCGNGYGASGIGTAVSSPLRAVPAGLGGAVTVVGEGLSTPWQGRLPGEIVANEGRMTAPGARSGRWHGPDADGMLWHEFGAAEDGSTRGTGLKGLGLRCRATLTPTPDGLRLRITLIHLGAAPLHHLRLSPATLDMPPLELPVLAPGETRSCDWRVRAVKGALSVEAV